MFDIEEVLKLRKFDYKNICDRLASKKNKTKIEDTEFKNVISGMLLVIIASVMAIILNILIAEIVITKFPEYTTGVNKFGIPTSMKPSVFSFIPIITSFLFFIICIIKKNKEQGNRLYNVIIIYCLVMIALFIFKLIPCFVIFKIDVMYAILGVLLNLFIIISYLLTIVGCLDFSLRVRKIYDEEHKPYESNLNIQTSTISVNDVSMHTNTYKCPRCNRELSSNYCTYCGQTIE